MFRKLFFVVLNYVSTVFCTTNFSLLHPDGRSTTVTTLIEDLGLIWVQSPLISLGVRGVMVTPGDSRIDVLRGARGV